MIAIKEHRSWKHFEPQPGEDWLNENGLDKYTQRVNKEVCNIDKSVLEQSMYKLYNYPGFKNEFSYIDFYKVDFVLEKWPNDDINNIQPPKFSGTYLDERIQALKDLGGRIEDSSYGHLKELVKYWRQYGTWCVPIIVIKSTDFVELPFRKPYQLFEGHNRLAWAKYFINNQSDLNLAEEHAVWVIKKA